MTIFVLEPAFEVIMVFDKEKHGRHVRKNGLANLSFVPGPELPQLVNLIVIWDKYLEVLSIEI